MITYDYIDIRQDNNENKETYSCKLCHYTTSKKKYINQHIKTKKHKSLMMITLDKTHKTFKTSEETAKKYVCECGNEYSYRQNLSRHRKKCVLYEEKLKNASVVEMLKLKNQVLELKNQILEMSKQNTSISNFSNNTKISNSFNTKNEIKIFLNEKCSGALSIQEFINHLTITSEDLDNNKSNTIESITNILKRNLKPLSITNRPIHHVDKDEWFMKDQEEWREDDGDVFVIRTHNKYQKEALLNILQKDDNGDNYDEAIYKLTQDLSSAERSKIKGIIKNNCNLD